MGGQTSWKVLFPVTQLFHFLLLRFSSLKARLHAEQAARVNALWLLLFYAF